MKGLKIYYSYLTDKTMMITGVRVALTVGSILFIINHGYALFNGQMTRGRWFSAVLTYIVPYCVNIHGQMISRQKYLLEQTLERVT